MRALLLTAIVMMAGCSGSPQAQTEVLDDVDAAPVYETINITEELHTTVDWSGNTLQGVWLCDVPQCPVGHFQTGPAYRSTAEYQGTLSNFTLRLEWTPADATQTGLALQVRDGVNGPVLGLWQGSSSFDVDVQIEDGNGTLAFAVWPVAKSGNIFIDATEQPFTLTGTITGTQTRQEERLAEA